MSNGKSISTNAIFNVLYKVLNALFPLVTATYIARVLLAEGVGKVAYAQNIAQYFVYIAALGLPTYGTREIAKARDIKSENDKVFSELFLINAISTTCCIAGYITLINIFGNFASDRILYYVTGISIVLNYINVDWVYQGNEEFKYIALRSIVVKTVSVVSIFIFVRTRSDYVIYALIHCFAVAGNYIFNVINLKKYVRFNLVGLDFRRHLKPLFVLLSSSIAIELYTLVDTTMLGTMCTKEIVGYYTNAMKLVKIVITILAAVVSVMLPRLSHYFKNGEKEKFVELVQNTISVMLVMSIPCAIGLFSVADFIIPVLFGKDFLQSINVLRVLCFLMIPIPFSTFIGTQVLCAIDQEKKMLIGVVCGAITNLILNSLLIPILQHNGAAIASLVSECVVLIVELYLLKRELTIKLDVRTIGSCGIAALVMLGIVFLSALLNLSNLLQLCISTLLGAVTYIVLMILFRNKGLVILLESIKHRAIINRKTK